MKTKTILIFIILFSITSSFSALGQKNNFTGEWKLNKEKTVLADARLFLSKVTLQLKSDSLLTTRVYENENGEEYLFKENLSLNGKECKISIFEMPRVSKASRSASDGAITIESVTTFYGDNGEMKLIAKENWNVDSEGKTLTLSFTNKMAENESAGTNYYSKIK